ncbi:PREDICTED: uncharacterized protein LOC104611701 isoform X2 [Nelumbo nucifera]|uniref:Uncharacterized protein LOC104611701 isoform X2 n=1 Tax=Nelumbo nucifera TaxID=4432 RepID=A0A1U8B7Y9_NELNU|nr:PREDICTED: uncharacterized protein LOC104611701 isoform X2 [Nelumbo nucifera]
MASSCMRWRKMWLKRKSTMEELYWRVPEMEKCCLCMENSYGRHIETKIELNLISTRQSRHLPATGSSCSWNFHGWRYNSGGTIEALICHRENYSNQLIIAHSTRVCKVCCFKNLSETIVQLWLLYN